MTDGELMTVVRIGLVLALVVVLLRNFVRGVFVDVPRFRVGDASGCVLYFSEWEVELI